jgi:hypothetical protein
MCRGLYLCFDLFLNANKDPIHLRTQSLYIVFFHAIAGKAEDYYAFTKLHLYTNYLVLPNDH